MSTNRDALMIDRQGGAPVYRQIADELRSEIRSGRFGPGVALPSERKLMDRFGAALAVRRSRRSPPHPTPSRRRKA